MRHYGDYDANAVVYMEFTTVANGNSVAQTLANGNIVVFKDNSNANSIAGVTLNVDWGLTGRHLVAINTAANGTYYAGGSFFHAALANGNTAGTSVAGYGVGSFTVRADSALKPTVAGRTLGVDASGFGDANVRLWNCATMNANITGNITGTVGNANGTLNVNLIQWLAVAPQQLGGANGVVINGINGGNITTNLVANMTGSVNTVNGNVTVGTIADNAITSTVLAAGAITATKFAASAIDAAALATSAVNEIRDAIFSIVMPECVGDPGATPTFSNAVMLGFMAVRNKRVVDATNSNETIHNSAGSVLVTACVSDNGSVFTKEKFG